MEEKGTVKDKSRIFAIDIIHLYKRLTESKKEYVLSKQLLRCGTSIASLMPSCLELKKMLSSITKTLRDSLNYS